MQPIKDEIDPCALVIFTKSSLHAESNMQSKILPSMILIV